MFWNKRKKRIKELEHENERLKIFLLHVADTVPNIAHGRSYSELIKRVVRMENMEYFKLKTEGPCGECDSCGNEITAEDLRGRRRHVESLPSSTKITKRFCKTCDEKIFELLEEKL